MKKSVLVTGANGFIGKELCRELLVMGCSVRPVFRSLPQVIENHFVSVGDINGDTDWREALAGIDVVVHLAARVHVMNEKAENPLRAFREVNVGGTLNLARQAAAAKVSRLVYISTVKVNGEATTDRPFSEEDLEGPLDLYGISKFEAEKGLFDIASRTALEVVVVRPPLVYGPGVRANFYTIMVWLARGIPLPFGAIDNKRSFISLGNLVNFIITCIDHPAAINNVFFVTDGEDMSTPELCVRLGKALGKPVRLFPCPQLLLNIVLKLVGKRNMAQRIMGSLQMDTSKASSILGWSPSVSLDDEIERTVEWYRNSKTRA